jgi:peptidoglycan/LPS O-acetylase OafA/YrhL
MGLPSFGRTPGGLYAVTVFFALSGFLITFLLLREKERTGNVSISQFYVRRTLRIWPLYFLFLGCALLYNYLVGEPNDKTLVVYSLLFAANIPSSLGLFIGNAAHLWSLGVEEQFYLIWPWMIRFARKPIYALIAFLVIFLLVKATLRFGLGASSPYYMFFHITRFDCMALGGIGAWLYARGIPAKLQTILFSIPMQVICWLSLAATIPDRFHVFSIADHALIGLATVVLILNLIANPKPLFRLENRVWNYLGGISFGIYMWHPLIVALNGQLLPYLPFPAGGKIAFLMMSVVVETILLAHLSMKFIEAPFLRIKERFSAAKAT